MNKLSVYTLGTYNFMTKKNFKNQKKQIIFNPRSGINCIDT